MVVCPQTNTKVFSISCKDCRERDICEVTKSDTALIETDTDSEDIIEEAVEKKIRKIRLMYAAIGIAGIGCLLLSALVAKVSIYLTFVFLVIGCVLVWIEAVRGIKGDIVKIKNLRDMIRQNKAKRKQNSCFPNWQQYFDKGREEGL